MSVKLKHKHRRARPDRIDPTRTVTVRKRYVAEIRRRFARLRGDIVRLLMDDVFGIKRRLVGNVFCATGEGGGVDSSCSAGGITSAAAKLYPTAGKTVDGREVLDNIDNLSSIGSSIDGDYEELPGIREVQVSDFPGLTGRSYSAPETQRIKDLAAKIKASGKISPLIVVDDGHPDGPYILEGGHRGEALKLLGAKSFPALVVLATDDIDGQEKLPPRLGGVVTNAADDSKRSWQFKTSSEQVKAFQEWLRERFGHHLSIKQLMKRFAEEGYKRGIGRAFDDVEKPYAQGFAMDYSTGDFYKPSKMQFLKSAFGSPVGKERVEQLASRSFDDLKNVTSDMSTRMSRTLLEGLVDGSHPNDIAKRLSKDIDISQGRAEMIARTEIIRAHAEGQLDAMQAMGVAEVGVQVEWLTARDDAVCPRCAAMEGVVMPIEQAHNRIPMHPNCRCSFTAAGDVLYPKPVGEAADDGFTENVFCATGEGGGVDPTCGAGVGAPTTKEFKNWFGDSKVVDESGAPLVVYHGTASEFDTFRTGTKNSWSDTLGFDTYFFSEGKATASTYSGQFANGKIQENYLSIKKPLEIDANGGEWMDALSEAIEKIQTYRTPEEKEFIEVKERFNEQYGYEAEYEPDNVPEEATRKVEDAGRRLTDHILANKKLYQTAKKQPYGYDGIVVKNVLDMTAAGVDEDITDYSPFTTVYIAFKPNQIKSTKNKGTFSATDDRITNVTITDLVNVFCPTGAGGGVDPTCSPSGSSHVTTLSVDRMNADERAAITSAIDKALTVAGRKIRINKIAIGESKYSAHYSGGKGEVIIGDGTLEYARDVDSIHKFRDEVQREHGTVNTTKELGNTSAEILALEVAHELGHHVEHVLQLDLQKAHRNVSDAGGDLSSETIQKMSGYSTVNIQERFAEAHALVSMGMSDRMPKSVRDWYDAALATADPEGLKKYIISNVYCPTGPGGGIDPTCSPGGSSSDTVGAPKTNPANKEAASALIAKLKVYKTKLGAARVKQLADTLSKLTVKQLNELKAEHAIDVKGKVKAELIKRLTEKLKDKINSEKGKTTKVDPPVKPPTTPTPNNPIDALPKDATVDQRLDAVFEHALKEHPSQLSEKEFKRMANLKDLIAKGGKYTMGKAEYEKRVKEHADLYGKYLKLGNTRQEAIAKQREVLLKAFTVETSADIKVGVGVPLHKSGKPYVPKLPEEKEAMDNAVNFVTALTAQNGQDDPLVFRFYKHASDGRAHQTQREYINVGDSQKNAGVIVHEMAHAIEDQKPGTLEKMKEFLANRTKGETPKNVWGSKKEYGLDDDFKKVFGASATYVGKTYPNSNIMNPKTAKHTEVLSMGLQKLYEDPIRFIRKDREFAKFIIETLRDRTHHAGGGAGYATL